MHIRLITLLLSLTAILTARALDVPAAVSGVTIVDKETYISVYWKPVSKVGLNGGEVVTRDVYYNFYKVLFIYEAGQPTDVMYQYIKHLKGSRTDIDVPGLSEGDQEPVYYAISAENSAGEGPLTIFSVLKGAPYRPPFTESFADGRAGSYLETETSGPDVMIGICDRSSDDDAGALLISGAVPGNIAAITTGKISLQADLEPMMSLDTDCIAGAPLLRLTVTDPADDVIGEEWLTPADMYQTSEYPLAAYADNRWIRVCMTVFAGGEEPSELLIDNIRFYNIVDDGVEAPADDEIPTGAEIFTLSGVQVAGYPDHLAPGIYIVRKGGRVRKFVVR